MDKYCIIEKKMYENHAGAKAREDIATILLQEKWIPFVVHHSEQKGTLDKLKMAFLTHRDWRYVYKHIPAGADLILQYPLAMYPKVSMLAIPILKKLKEKNVRRIFLIHDLESLRGGDSSRERAFLNEADVIIAHNSHMIQYLRNIGYKNKKMISLDIFDYLMKESDCCHKNIDDWKTVAIAGNLRKDKAGYVYLLDKLNADVRFYLYGPNYEGKEEGKNVTYQGQYSPEQLPEKLQCGFGLVWDGPSLEKCGGNMGKYLKYNNPHKTSLYLASGIPVIIWKEAAMADLINEKQVGLVVDSLEDISDKFRKLQEEEYTKLKKNAEKLGKQLRTGAMLKTAISLL
ncbi:MAG: hypothetical protein ACLU6W_04860 [Lachnospiraceae bacterium]